MTFLKNEELKHLEKLSCIKIDDEQESVFLKKLDSVVTKLNDLNKIDTNDINITNSWDNTLRTLQGINNFENKKWIINNVKHEVINNSIVIKSSLSN